MAEQGEDVEIAIEGMYPGLIKQMTRNFREIMDKEGSRQTLVREVDVLYRSSVEDFAKAEADAGRLACAAGCSACCSQRVELMESEVPDVLRAINRLGGTVRKQVLKRLRRQARLEIATPDPEQYREPCSLLDEAGRCLIYAARPTACRKAVSSNATHCQAPGTVVFDENPSLVAASLFSTGLEFARTAVLLQGSLPRPLAGALLEVMK
jgi:hypothetical protein